MFQIFGNLDLSNDKALIWLTRKGLQVLRLGYKMQQDNVVKTEYIKETVLFIFYNSQRQEKIIGKHIFSSKFKQMRIKELLKMKPVQSI